MAAKTKTPAAPAVSETPAPVATPAAGACGGSDVVVAVACALLQSPRFAAKITDERQQDVLVDTARRLAAKLQA